MSTLLNFSYSTSTSPKIGVVWPVGRAVLVSLLSSTLQLPLPLTPAINRRVGDVPLSQLFLSPPTVTSSLPLRNIPPPSPFSSKIRHDSAVVVRVVRGGVRRVG